MASKLTLFFLISTTVALLIVSYFLVKQGRREGFENPSYSVKNLNITMCPTYTTEIQTAKGNTDCCQGDMVDGKCNGTTFCTKSPAYADIPSCVDKWRSYFTEKSTSTCPPSMPNYYEDVTNSAAPKGCSAGAITEDGKMPKDTLSKQCKIYTSEEDNKTKPDSCHNEKLRALFQCPVVNGSSPTPSWSLDTPDTVAYIKCDYPFELGVPQTCAEKTTLEAYATKRNPNWRTSTLASSQVNELSCDNYITLRNSSAAANNKLETEMKARADAEAAAKASADARAQADAAAKKSAEDASRLQQQLDEANRKLQSCKP